MFNSIDEGYCVIDIVFDNNNKPCDYCFAEVNAAFEKQTGLINPVGKCISEMAPTHEQYWFDIYGEVMLTGKPLRFQKWTEEFQRHYDVYASRISKPGEKKIAVLFNVVTEKKRAVSRFAFRLALHSYLLFPGSDKSNSVAISLHHEPGANIISYRQQRQRCDGGCQR